MLETLRVRNYALIDTVELEFGNGFNVITGETGAGKSIIIGALGLVLGARASADSVRSGADRATVEASFHIGQPSDRLRAILDERDIELEDGSIILSRTVFAEGRSKAYAGGRLIPLNVLAEIGDELVDLHGQHDHQSLLHADRQLELIDGYANLESSRAEIRSLVRELRACESEIAALEGADRDQARQVEFLKFELQEIEKADLQPGEDDELKRRQQLIAHAEAIVNAASSAYTDLFERDGDAAVDLADRASRAIEELVDAEPAFKELAAQIESARVTLVSVAEELRAHMDLPEFEPGELDQVQQRLETIRSLKRKFGDSIDAILAYAEKARGDVAAFENRDSHLADLQKKRTELHEKTMAAAQKLRKKRLSTAKTLQKVAETALHTLGMKGARFEARIDKDALSESGIDRAQFQLAANTGEKMGSLRSVASGGEISRVMLALKATFAQADAIPTLIFDEIDAGVGGAVANQVAEKLDQLAQTHQVICITHLPQIAAAAKAHYHVAKEAANGRTTTAIAAVEGDSRVEELARLLDGSVSDVSLAHARSLLS